MIAPSVEVGLEQEWSMPQDSHVRKYFQVNLPVQTLFTLYNYLILVFGQISGHRPASLLGDQRKRGLLQSRYQKQSLQRRRLHGKLHHHPNQFGMQGGKHVSNKLFNLFARQCTINNINYFSTYMSTQSNSWLDDFYDWADTEKCCKYFEANSSFCPHTYTDEVCSACYIGALNMDESEYYEKYLPYFLMDNPDSTCAKGGHASYYQVNVCLVI